MAKRFIIVKGTASIICKSPNLNNWQFSDLLTDKPYLLTFPSIKAARDFINSYGVNDACIYFGFNCPNIVKKRNSNTINFILI